MRQRDKMTPYKLTQGSDYNRPVCVFGEQVLAKVPIAESKLGRKWLKGVWLGKLDRDDSHVIGTLAGAIAVRSVRRLPKAEQVGTDLMAEMRGLPWKPRDGHRKFTRDFRSCGHACTTDGPRATGSWRWSLPSHS